MPEVKLCKDCRHAVPPAEPSATAHDWGCGRTRRPEQPDYVMGAPVVLRPDRCLYVRDDHDRCGPEGKWWEPIEVAT